MDAVKPEILSFTPLMLLSLKTKISVYENWILDAKMATAHSSKSCLLSSYACWLILCVMHIKLAFQRSWDFFLQILGG